MSCLRCNQALASNFRYTLAHTHIHTHTCNRWARTHTHDIWFISGQDSFRSNLFHFISRAKALHPHVWDVAVVYVSSMITMFMHFYMFFCFMIDSLALLFTVSALGYIVKTFFRACDLFLSNRSWWSTLTMAPTRAICGRHWMPWRYVISLSSLFYFHTLLSQHAPSGRSIPEP